MDGVIDGRQKPDRIVGFGQSRTGDGSPRSRLKAPAHAAEQATGTHKNVRSAGSGDDRDPAIDAGEAGALSITVQGGGFVGLTTAVVLAEAGHTVTIVEPDARRRSALQGGRVPFFEPGLDAAFADVCANGRIRVHATLGPDAPDVVFVCVGTPSGADGAVDLGQVLGATRDLADTLKTWVHPPVIVVKSTVPPGTTREHVLPVLQKAGAPGTAFGLAMSPEFLREGSALADARAPDRIVIGCLDDLARTRLSHLHQRASCPVFTTSPETAELAKYAANGMLAVRLAFVNEMARLAEAAGTDIDEVMQLVGLDARIGPHFLRAGPGFGGSCFPKDLRALRQAAAAHGIETGIIDAALAGNDLQPKHVVDMVRRALGTLRGRRIAMLGVAFKAGTSDVRETRARPIHEALEAAGAEVVVHDVAALADYQALMGRPVATAADVRAALEGANACVVHTDWPEYAALDPSIFAQKMKTAIVIDTRRLWDPGAMRRAGVRYHAVGRATTTGPVLPPHVVQR